MFKELHCQQQFYLIIISFLTYFVNIIAGPNTLHTYDGTSTAEIISGDIFFEIVDPIELEYTYRLRPAKDFGAPFNESFNVKNIPLVPIFPQHGCETPHNSEDIEGNVAFIERGECSFKRKTLVAERAGAVAVIITDMTKVNEDYFIEMVDDDTDDDAGIPAGFLMGKNGFMIVKTLEKLRRNYAIINLPVNLTFTPVHKMNQPPWLGW